MPVEYQFQIGEKTYQCVAKWSKEEIAQMCPAQLINVLNEMILRCRYEEDYFSLPIHNMSRRLYVLEEEKKQAAIFFAIAAVIFFVAMIVVTGMMKIGGFLRFLSIVGVFFLFFSFIFTIVGLVKFIFALSAYNREAPTLRARIDDISKKCEEFSFKTHLNETGSYILVLPVYWCDPVALRFMVSVLQNRRATNLSQAIFLYEEERKTDSLWKTFRSFPHHGF